MGFDTFTTQNWFPKYFEYTYGIDAAFDLRMLVEAGFVEVESAADSGFGDCSGTAQDPQGCGGERIEQCEKGRVDGFSSGTPLPHPT